MTIKMTPDVPDGITLDDEPVPAGITLDSAPEYRPTFYGAGAPPKKGSYAGEEESFWKNSSVGRIMSAFGQGVKTGFGDEVIGFSPETRKALQDAGVFADAERRHDVFGAFKAFNEAVMRPAAAGLEAVARGVKAVNYGVGFSAGQLVKEFGSTEGDRLTRDMIMLGDTSMLLTGAFPILPKPGRGTPFTDTLRRTDLPDETLILGNKLDDPNTGPMLLQTPKDSITKGATVQQFDTAEIGAQGQTIGPRTVLPEQGKAAGTDFAGGINLDRLNTIEDVKQLMRDQAGREDYAPAGRGPVTYAEAQDLAAANGMSLDTYMKMGPDAPLTSIDRLKVRQLLVQNAEETWAKVRQAQQTKDEVDVLNAGLAIERFKVAQEYAEGVKAEAGRTLSLYNAMATADDKAAALKGVFDSMGGRQSLDLIIEKIGLLETPQEIAAFLQQARKPPTLGQKAVEAWRMMLVSGPWTHLGNISSNALFSAAGVVERGVASAIGAARQAVGVGSKERIAPGEALALLRGYGEGSKDGILGFWEALKTGKSRETRALPPEQVKGGAIGGVTGEVVRLPGRALVAEDEFFRAWGYHQELRAQIERRIDFEGLKGGEAKAARAEWLQNPDAALVEAAKQYADYVTFQKKLGDFGGAIQRFTHEHPIAGFAVPFIRTPANIFKAFNERSPTFVFSKKIIEDVKGVNGGAKQDLAIARLGISSAIGWTVVNYALDEMITGSAPTDPKGYASYMASGKRPYSVRIGDTYYSYRRWSEPFGSIMGLFADAAQMAPHMSEGDYAKVASLGVLSISQNVLNMSAMRGPADLVKVMGDWTRYGDKFIQNLTASMLVPNFVGQVMRHDDPYLREARTVLDAVKVRAQGQYSGVFPRRDVFGEPMKRDDGVGAWQWAEVSKDPVVKELNDLGMWPAKLRREIRGVELTPDQYDRYSEVSGKLMRQILNGAVNQPGWANLPAPARRETLEKLMARSRQSGQAWFLAMYPEIIGASTQLKLDEARGIKRAKK